MGEVEIFWPGTVAQDGLLDAASQLETAGIETTCRIQPTRRGVETTVLILMAGSALEPFLKAMFERIGDEAYTALRAFVRRIFRQDSPDIRTGKDVPDVVIFESSTTRAQFVFTAGLPNDAFKKAVELEPGADPGRWVWESSSRRWLRFEDQSPVNAQMGAT